MKNRPNISAINLRSNTFKDKMQTLSEMVKNDITGSVLEQRPKPVPSKTKSAPIKIVQPNYLDKMLDYKLDMFDYIASEKKLNPNLLIEYPTYYVLTITNYAPMQGYDTLTSKDFDIYINGVRLDVIDYSVKFVNGYITFTVQKLSVGNGYNEENFLICGAFTD